MLGVLAAAFWLVPTLGLARTAALCVVLNLVCAALALRWFACATVRATRPSATAAAPRTSRAGAALRWRCWPLTGLLGIGYEVLVVRVLSQVAEDTVYTFALLLAVYLVGSALGAAAWQRWRAARRPTPTRLRGRLLRCAGARLPARQRQPVGGEAPEAHAVRSARPRSHGRRHWRPRPRWRWPPSACRRL